MASGTYGKKSVPTTPAMRRAILECDDDHPTETRCPTCRGRGSILPEHAAALEAEARKRDADK